MAAKRKAPAEPPAPAVKAKAARKGPPALSTPRAAAAQLPASQDELDGGAQQNTNPHKSKSQKKSARKALAAARGKAKAARGDAGPPGAAEPAGNAAAGPDASDVAKGAKPGKAAVRAAGGGKRGRTTAAGAAGNTAAGTGPEAANGHALASARHGPTGKARHQRSAAVARVATDAQGSSLGEDDDDDDDSDDSDLMDELDQDGAELAAPDSVAAAANGGSAGGAQRAAGRDTAARVSDSATGGFRNKEKVLILSSRGIPHRYRHLMLDLGQLLPHAKKDFKLDTKSDRGVINEVADLKGCSSVLFFEARKKQDCYLWVAKTPSGPCAKFHVANVHTMAELKLSGNHLKGSRPLLSFDKGFDEEPHLQLLREMLRQLFATPAKHHKGKPFSDHVLSFHVADGRIWLRNYQLLPPAEKRGELSLVEVGPRCCLNPIRVFAGSFGGPVIYENASFVSPNLLRAAVKRQQAGKYKAKVANQKRAREHRAANPLPKSELADVFRA